LQGVAKSIYGAPVEISLVLVPSSIDLVADELFFSHISIMRVKHDLLVQRTTLIAPPKEKWIRSSELCSNTIF
jgi:hypothetical protein